MDHLDALESKSIFILREAFNKIEKLAMLWSLGKDSNVMIWLARKAFYGHVPFPCIHIDTGKKFPAMYAFRDEFSKNGTSIYALETVRRWKKWTPPCRPPLGLQRVKRLV